MDAVRAGVAVPGSGASAPPAGLYRERSGPLMAAMDACNGRFGRGTVVPARAGLAEKWTQSTKFETRSPRYTTQVAELPTAHA